MDALFIFRQREYVNQKFTNYFFSQLLFTVCAVEFNFRQGKLAFMSLMKAAFPVVDTESIVVQWSRENENRAGNIAQHHTVFGQDRSLFPLPSVNDPTLFSTTRKRGNSRCFQDETRKSCESQFREKIPVLTIEKFPFLVLPRNMIMFRLPIVQFHIYYLSSGCLREVELNRKKSNFNLSVNVVAVAYERWSFTSHSIDLAWKNVWYFGKLVAEESGRIRVMVATEGWTMLNKPH